jgi:hypothetical protein
MKTIPISIAATTFSLFLFTLSLPAATFSLNPSADAFVTPGSSGGLSPKNYGAAGGLAVAAAGLANGEFQSVLRFDLSATKASFDSQFGAGQWSVQSISLSLTATAPNNAIFNASAAGLFGISWMQNDSWVEGTGTPAAPTSTGITFASLPSFISPGDQSLGTFAFPGGTSGTVLCPLALTSGLSADATAGSLVSLRFLAADTAVSFLFDSRNFGTASARPLLSIVAVPEPAALSLLALGGSLLLAMRRSRRPIR